MAWRVDGNVWIERNADGTSRLIRHLMHPFIDLTAGDNPYRLALSYLRVVQQLLGVTDAEIAFLQRTIPAVDKRRRMPPAGQHGSLLSWRQEILRREVETILLTIQQTHDGVVAGGHPDTAFSRSDVEAAGLRIVLNRSPSGKNPLHITGVTSSLRRNFNFGRLADPRPKVGLPRFRSDPNFVTLQPKDLNKILANFGFAQSNPDPGGRRSAIPGRQLVHRYRITESQRHGPAPIPSEEGAPQADTDYLAVAVRVIPPVSDPEPPGRLAAYDMDAEEPAAICDPPAEEFVARLFDFAPLAGSTLLANVLPVIQNGKGTVFMTDPITATGDFTLRPNAGNPLLNTKKVSVTIPDLFVPEEIPPVWKLSGPHVKLDGEQAAPPYPCGGIGYRPPTGATPDFDFDVRTNDFAAVNAYYHCARFFMMLDAFKLPFTSFPAGYKLPLRVLHRGSITPGPCSDGNCINAQAQIIPPLASVRAPFFCDSGQDPIQPQIQFRFALADLQLDPGSLARPLAPLGIACDVRVLWHEFCHALIAASTDRIEFPFAHSAGDALAAINCDPGSKLAEGGFAKEYRGVTFPWTAYANRRHDREARQGWSWDGPLGTLDGYQEETRDPLGYAREQVLSSTLFRLYCSIDGDATDPLGHADLDRRRAAAEYTTYLVVAAIYSLGPAVTVPVIDAGAFADAIMQADVGIWSLDTPAQTQVASMGRIGGTVHKVIRWTFEKQGLYGATGQPRPQDGSGNPPPIDVYIEDQAERKGEYYHTPNWHAAAAAVWNRHQPDGDVNGHHQRPLENADNYVYVQICNRGYQDAVDTELSVFIAPAVARSVWPDPAWVKLALAPGGIGVTIVPANDCTTLGPFLWHPAMTGEFMILSAADAIGDLSNIAPASLLPCTQIPGVIESLVPLDNNLGLSRWAVN